MPKKEVLYRQLHSDVQRALKQVQRITGSMPRIRSVDHLPQDTRARLVRPTATQDRYEIQYQRGQERMLDHLVLHELGHLVRLHRVPPFERLTAVVTGECRINVAERLISEMQRLFALGLPEEVIVDLLIDWHQGVVTQLENFPADLRIEQWIHDTFPGLRRLQERDLVEEVHRADPLFAPAVVQSVPSEVYIPTMAMNAAQAWHVARLYGHVELLNPFIQAGFANTGRELMRSVFAVPDEGHRSDTQASNHWAEALGLSGWLSWELPDTGR